MPKNTNVKKLAYTFKSDLLFKMLFARNQDLLKRLVSVILKINKDDITKFVVKNSEIEPEEIETKFCKIDIRMKVNEELVNLEVQALDRGNYPERTLYYGAKEVSSALPAGKDYITLPKVIIISIIDFILFGGDTVHSEFSLLEVNRHELLTDRLVFHYFELPKLKNIDAGDELSLWLSLFDAETEQELETLLKLEVDFVKQVIQEYKNITADENYRELERRREMRLHDEASALGHARRERDKHWQGIVSEIVSEKNSVIFEKDNVISEKDNVISEKDNMLSEKDNVISEKDNMLSEKDSILYERDNEIALLLKKISELEKNQ